MNIKVEVDYIKVEFLDLKTELLRIQSDYENKMLINAEIESIAERYRIVFHYFGLQDLQWRLIKNEDTKSVTFVPLRTIDKYAIIGILQ